MKSLNQRLGTHFAASAAAVGAAFVTSGADATVVYSGPVNIAIPVNIDGVYLNVVTGLTGTSGAGTAGWDINPYSASSLTWFIPSTPANSHGAVRNAVGGASATLVDNLAIGFVVGATLPGSATATNFGSGGSETAATSSTKFNLNSDANYVGFRFYNEGTAGVHYGYMQLHLGATMIDPTRSILGYWYEDAAATSITVGIPTPGALSLLALTGLAGCRRRIS